MSLYDTYISLMIEFARLKNISGATIIDKSFFSAFDQWLKERK